MSDNTLNKGLRVMGRDIGPGGDHRARGFRSTSSTLHEESAFDGPIVEAQLAHDTEKKSADGTTRCAAPAGRRLEFFEASSDDCYFVLDVLNSVRGVDAGNVLQFARHLASVREQIGEGASISHRHVAGDDQVYGGRHVRRSSISGLAAIVAGSARSGQLQSCSTRRPKAIQLIGTSATRCRAEASASISTGVPAMQACLACARQPARLDRFDPGKALIC
jgi:hypothetical protein